MSRRRCLLHCNLYSFLSQLHASVNTEAEFTSETRPTKTHDHKCDMNSQQKLSVTVVVQNRQIFKRQLYRFVLEMECCLSVVSDKLTSFPLTDIVSQDDRRTVVKAPSSWCLHRLADHAKLLRHSFFQSFFLFAIDACW